MKKQNTNAVPWGEEESPYNLYSSHYDLDYMVMYLIGGFHPNNSSPTRQDVINHGLENGSHWAGGTVRISRDDTISINVNPLTPEDKVIAFGSTETYAVLLGYDVVETDAKGAVTREEDYVHASHYEGDFATIGFDYLTEENRPPHALNAGGLGTFMNFAPRIQSIPGNHFSEVYYYLNNKSWVQPDLVDEERKMLFVHEIGHNFGLWDTSKGSYIDSQIDNELVTAMTYNDMDGDLFLNERDDEYYLRHANNYLPLTPMIADIIALDLHWGLAEEIMHGDTTYGRNANTGMHWDNLLHDMAQPDNHTAMTIMDTGGYDTLDFSDHDPAIHQWTINNHETGRQHKEPAQLRINMNPYWTSDVYSTKMNFIIGPDTWIERAIGGVGNDHITGNSIDNDLIGNAGDDTLLGGPGNDTLHGGPGADVLDGHTGIDTAAYTDSDAAVNVNLATKSARGGHATGDTLISIENLTGSRYNDTLTGDSNDNVLNGGTGADTLDGQTGADTATYTDSAVAVNINLATKSARGGHATGDTLISIENLTGSRYDDTLIGDSNDNILNGGTGADTLDGQTGTDTATYTDSDAAVNVNLSTNTARGGHATGDTLASIESLVGSRYNDTLTGDGGANILAGLEGDDRLYGGPQGGDDTLLGGAGNDHLYGGLGMDILLGGPGTDLLRGGPDTDTLDGGTGDDLLDGGPGADVLSGSAGLDTADYSKSDAGVTVRLHTLTALGGYAQGDTFGQLVPTQYTKADGSLASELLPDIEHITGSAHADVLAGDRRNNILDGQAGDDTLYGGPGGGDDVMLGGEGDDRIYGGTGDDRLTGGPGHDGLYGGAGNDTLYGGTGNDHLRGEKGNDVLIFSPGHDIFDGGTGHDTISFKEETAAVILDLNDPSSLSIEILSIEGIMGTHFNDTLTGDAEDNQLIGLAGNDILKGGPGDDRFQPGPGTDTVDGGAGTDTIDYSKAQSNIITSSTAIASADVLTNIEIIIGSNYNDILAGPGITPNVTDSGKVSSFTYHIHHDHNNITIYGGAGDDNIKSGNGNDTLYGGLGNDVIWASGGNNTLNGGPGRDRITADAGDDVMHGGEGNDSIYGGAGDDTLGGGPGDDVLTPGSGRDVLWFRPGDGDDVVRNFNALEDSIDLTNFELDEDTNLVITAQGEDYFLDLRPYDGGTVTFTEIQQDGEFVFVV